MPLRHIVLLRWSGEAGRGDIDAVEQALAELPGQIPEIASYHFGRDLGLSAGSCDFAIVAAFETQADWETYRDHPAHIGLIRDLIAPILETRVAVQIDLADP